jgi:hypothetical protein
MRQPGTQKELAGILDVCPDTLTRWKKDPQVRDLVYDLVRDRLEAELPDIFQVIIDEAKAGKYQFVKLSLELLDKYSNKLTLETDTPTLGIEQYSEIIKLVEQLKDD